MENLQNIFALIVDEFTGEVTGEWLSGAEEIEWVEVENASGDELTSNSHDGAVVAVTGGTVTITTDKDNLSDSAAVNVYLKATPKQGTGNVPEADITKTIVTVKLKKAQ